MPHLPQPCPFSDECHGTVETHPEIETRYTFNARSDNHYVTAVTVTCMLVAACTNCTFSEIADTRSKEIAFDLVNHTVPWELKFDWNVTSKARNKTRRRV